LAGSSAFEARLEVRIDGPAAAKLGVAAKSISAALRRIPVGEEFSLAQVRKLPVPTVTGDSVPLERVAQVEVILRLVREDPAAPDPPPEPVPDSNVPNPK